MLLKANKYRKDKKADCRQNKLGSRIFMGKVFGDYAECLHFYPSFSYGRIIAGDTTSSYGTQYAYYAAGNTPAKTRRTSTTKRRHWTRDTDPDNAVNFLYIDTTGAIASNKVTTSNMYVAFAFCF